MSSQVQPLINYLQQLQRKGETHVHLDETARKVLREFYLVAKGIKKIGPDSNPESPQKASAKISTTSQIVINGSSSKEKITSLTSQALHSHLPKTLGTLRDKLVFSGGNSDADIMLINDAPGYYEETKGHPFAGPAGEKLDGILKAMGIRRDDVYITHLVKYRPSMPNQTTANRKPSSEEIQAFSAFIDAEINIVKPKVILALGSVVAQHLVHPSSTTDQLRGKFHTITRTDIPVRVTYHPSYLLQNEANADKRKLWEDMLSIMEKLEIPITKKQQKFFLPKS